jgi:hypothetical protein
MTDIEAVVHGGSLRGGRQVRDLQIHLSGIIATVRDIFMTAKMTSNQRLAGGRISLKKRSGAPITGVLGCAPSAIGQGSPTRMSGSSSRLVGRASSLS